MIVFGKLAEFFCEVVLSPSFISCFEPNKKVGAGDVFCSPEVDGETNILFLESREEALDKLRGYGFSYDRFFDFLAGREGDFSGVSPIDFLANFLEAEDVFGEFGKLADLLIKR